MLLKGEKNIKTIDFFKVSLLFVLLFFMACGNKGSEGRLEDAAGKPVPGVRVKLAGYEKTVVTGDDGHFFFPLVGDGKSLAFSAGDEWPKGCLPPTAIKSSLEKDGQPADGGFGAFQIPCIVKKTPEGRISFASADSRWVDNSDGTITDSKNKLMWQGEDPGVKLPWYSATSYCKKLSLAGHDDWQLPDGVVLASLLQPAGASSIHPFLERRSKRYWSATRHEEAPINALAVYDANGASGFAHSSVTYFLRCVRQL